MFRKASTVSLIITAVAILGGLYLNTAITIQSPIDNSPQITSLKIEKTHNDPARIRKDHTFFFDYTMEATDDHKITWAFVIICEPDGNKTTINLVEVSGKYTDAFQAWDSGNYVFQFNVIDDANQKTVLETNRTIVYNTFTKYMQKYTAEGWNPEFLMEVYRLDKGKIETLYGTPDLENYLEDMLNLIDE